MLQITALTLSPWVEQEHHILGSLSQWFKVILNDTCLNFLSAMCFLVSCVLFDMHLKPLRQDFAPAIKLNVFFFHEYLDEKLLKYNALGMESF